MINKEQIEEAHNRIRQYVHRTPVMTSDLLNEAAGCRLFFKCENFQKIGAFKIRGAMNAALQIGLDINLARELVIETMKGSLEMLEQSGEHPALLRQDVSSPGGTTIAGIRKLEENGVRKAFFDAVEMAYNRSIELSSDD